MTAIPLASIPPRPAIIGRPMRANELAVLRFACAEGRVRRRDAASLLGVDPESSDCRHAFRMLTRSGYLVRLPVRGHYAPTPLAIEVTGHCFPRRSIAVPAPSSPISPPSP